MRILSVVFYSLWNRVGFLWQLEAVEVADHGH